MPTTFANTISLDGGTTNLPIYADRAEKDAAGNNLQTTYATKSEVTTGLSGKQDTISDLSDIRAGAALGDTAVQPSDLATVATTGAYSDLSGTPTIPPALSAGNGIDITNNVVSADLDGTSLTNGANGLSVTLPVPDTTGASQGDVLSVGQSGIEWTTLALTSGNVYKATSTDTYATLYQAYMVDHKLVYYGEGYPLILKNIMSDDSSNVSGRVYFQTSFMNVTKKVVILYDEKRLAAGAQLGSLTSYTQEIIPSSSGSHIGQFITPVSNGVMGWATINQVPASTSADENKVLTVNSSGNAEWATPSGGGSVTDVEVNGTSVVNASGVAEVSVPSGVQLVPAATSADADKVLTVDGQGIPGWAVVPSVSTGLFEAVYGQTSYSDIAQAISDKKIVYCRISATGASRMAFLAYIGTSNVEFQYYRSLNSHSASNMTDEVYVYKVDSSGWTTTTRKTGVKVVAGTHMSQSYSNDTLTLDCTWPTVDQTYDASSANAQSGVAVASAIAAAQTGLFEATYGTTTYADVLQAISDNKIVYCNAPGAGNTRRMAVMTFQGATNVEFQYYRSNSSGTDSVFIYTVSSEGWDTTERTVTGYASPTYNASSTLAQSGVAVASAIAGVNAVPASTSADADKVLTVDAQGTPAWASAQAPISAGNGIDITNNVVSVDTSVVATQTDLAGKEDAFDVGTGLEMDTSGSTPTLQVEAPVDIVAGPGIVIDNPDGNTLRVSQATPSDETVLWSNATGVQLSSGTTVTLSEVTTNFDRILAYHGSNDMAWGVVNTFPGIANRMELVRYSYDGAAYIIQDGQDLTTTDNKVFSASRNIRRLQFNTNGSFSLSTNQNTTFKLFKVVGIHRIANN